MMAAIQALLDADKDKVRGNHSVNFKDNKRRFIYHATAICIADDKEKTAVIDNEGYYTSSTTRAINDYINHFKDLNYKIIDNR